MACRAINRLAIASLLALWAPGCVMSDGPADQRPLGAGQIGSTSQAATICAPGAQTFGIDVSKYQGMIDWQAARNDGVEFAFVRVSDGLANLDEYFDRNWAETKRVGIARGAYQFFRPNLDALAQADLFLATMGPLEPGDLPPVIDVEVDGGQPPAAMASGIRQWIDRVEGALGVSPLIYTGRPFWDSAVGGTSEFRDNPLWIAHWTSASCPNITDAWSEWALWQYSATGRVAGIGGDVDLNYFAGSVADLAALGGGERAPCGVIAAEGGVIDDRHACFRAGGPPQFIRSERGGYGDGYQWTVATDFPDTSNYGEWTIHVAESGNYALEAYVPRGAADSMRATYEVGTDGGGVVIDQSTSADWVFLGEYNLDASVPTVVRLADNTGEPYGEERHLVFDAIRLTRSNTDSTAGPRSDADNEDESSGCAAGSTGETPTPSAPLVLGAWLLAVRRRRRIDRVAY